MPVSPDPHQPTDPSPTKKSEVQENPPPPPPPQGMQISLAPFPDPPSGYHYGFPPFAGLKYLKLSFSGLSLCAVMSDQKQITRLGSLIYPLNPWTFGKLKKRASQACAGHVGVPLRQVPLRKGYGREKIAGVRVWGDFRDFHSGSGHTFRVSA